MKTVLGHVVSTYQLLTRNVIIPYFKHVQTKIRIEKYGGFDSESISAWVLLMTVFKSLIPCLCYKSSQDFYFFLISFDNLHLSIQFGPFYHFLGHYFYFCKFSSNIPFHYRFYFYFFLLLIF